MQAQMVLLPSIIQLPDHDRWTAEQRSLSVLE